MCDQNIEGVSTHRGARESLISVTTIVSWGTLKNEIILSCGQRKWCPYIVSWKPIHSRVPFDPLETLYQPMHACMHTHTQHTDR